MTMLNPSIPGSSVPTSHVPASGAIQTRLLGWAIAAWSALVSLGARVVRRLRDDRGQATTEYALVLLAAALVALLVVAWATAGGGGARISRLFNRVVDAVIDRV